MSKPYNTAIEQLQLGLDIIKRLRSSGPDKLRVSQTTEMNILKALRNLLVREYPNQSEAMLNLISNHHSNLKKSIPLSKNEVNNFYYELATRMLSLINELTPLSVNEKKTDPTKKLILDVKNKLNALLEEKLQPKQINTKEIKEIEKIIKEASSRANLASTPGIEPHAHLMNLIENLKESINQHKTEKKRLPFFNKATPSQAYINRVNEKLDFLSVQLANNFRSQLQDIFYKKLAAIGKTEKINLALDKNHDSPSYKTHVAVDALIEKVIARTITKKEALEQLPDIIAKNFKATTTSFRRSI